MSDSPVLKHLFIDGEYMPRERLLSGLTLDQVTSRPGGCTHSIYDELWHAAEWQRIVVERDEEMGEAWQTGGNPFPKADPESLSDWQRIVDRFLNDSAAALDWPATMDARGEELDPGWTATDVLASLAVHNAYHMGKIVALRQMIGAWPPAP